jgi:hypothetical protein
VKKTSRVATSVSSKQTHMEGVRIAASFSVGDDVVKLFCLVISRSRCRGVTVTFFAKVLSNSMLSLIFSETVFQHRL